VTGEAKRRSWRIGAAARGLALIAVCALIGLAIGTKADTRIWITFAIYCALTFTFLYAESRLRARRAEKS
jgi:hypothetical protein